MQFIRRFQETQELAPPPKSDPKTHPPGATSSTAWTINTLRQEHHRTLDSLKLEYEARLAEQERELAYLRQTLATIGRLAGSGSANQRAEPPPPSRLTEPPSPPSGALDRWQKTIGKDSGTRRMLDYLAKKAPAGVTRSELAVAAGLSEGGGAYRRYLKFLTDQKLVVWAGGRLTLNPALLTKTAA